MVPDPPPRPQPQPASRNGHTGTVFFFESGSVHFMKFHATLVQVAEKPPPLHLQRQILHLCCTHNCLESII